ncbi:ribosome biogenesis GTP-binding protein YihA/YsxC [Fontimonas sp. SYSU GA230001]|uniref:ribosome biogenesis GTP-binding protein YihA/YsxC n=1 Tax=Fontimonas sp. SYSU GA230001 TaxID=3142450 RepID=UPI0032B45BF9
MRPNPTNPFASAQFLRSCARLDQLPDDERAELAFAGRSNAGKSSALNRLCGHNALARVSKTPGRTQLINLFDVPGGRFADLPGYGFAKVSKDLRDTWGALIGRYLETRANLCGVVLIMDVRHPLTPLDRQMLDWAVTRGLACHLLLTKADKLGYGAAKSALLGVRKALPQISTVSAQLFSAQTDLGLDEFRARVAGLLAAHGATEAV